MSNGTAQGQVQEQTSLYGFKFREPDERRREDRSTHDIKQLWQRSHEILNLALIGHKGTDIAKILGISPQTVSNTLNSTLGKETIAGKRKTRDAEYEKLQDEVTLLAEKALAVYRKIFDEPDDSPVCTLKMKKETADTVALELAGMRSPTRIDTRSVHTTATLDEINAFKQRGLQAARDSGMLVVVEGEGTRHLNQGDPVGCPHRLSGDLNSKDMNDES